MPEYDNKFNWVDYLLFAISLAIGVVVGVVLAIKEKWLSQSSESYLMANRSMNWFLVAMSFLASIMNARLFVAFTTEFYFSGFILIWLVLAYYVAGFFVTFFIVPKFFRLGFNITSAYEYFQHRFNLPVRLLVSFFYFFLTLLYMSVVLYIPSLVLSQVSVINIYWSIFLGAAVCLLYTGFGGMKAVIWVDSIQVLVIAIGMFALTIKGSLDVGGISVVWEKYQGIGERNNWNDIDPVPWNNYNVWNVSFMWGILLAGMMGADQTVLQRYMTVPTLRRAQGSVMMGVTVGILFLAQVAVLGMVIFAGIGGNDIYLNKKIQKPDEIMPFFLMYSLGEYHGIPGLVVAALFAATLSTLSSGQNALAAVVLEDFVKPIHRIRTGNALSARAGSITSRVLGVVIGILVLALSMAVPKFGGTLLSLSLTIQSFILGPVLGLIIVSFFMVWVESWGAFVGVLCSVGWAIMMWAGEQKYGNELRKDLPPLFLNNYTDPKRAPEPTAEPELWDVSYTWYTFLDICILIVVANIVSLIVHLCKKCCVKDYSIKATFPSDQFRFTKEDFLVAFGCKKNEMVYNKEEEMEDITTNGKQHKYEVDKEDENTGYNNEKIYPGLDNPAYLNSDRL